MLVDKVTASRFHQFPNNCTTGMDIFNSRFYRINAKLLTLLGLWPYHESRKIQIQQILLHISVITVMISQSIKMFEIWGNLDIMIECLTPMGVQFTACVKSMNCIINRDKMRQLLESIKSDWSNIKNVNEIKILTKYAEQGRNLTLIYSGYMFSTMTLYLLMPLSPQILDFILPLNETRPLTYLYQTEYYVDPEEYFYAILIHTYMGSIIAVITIVAADTMYATYVQHVCGVLAVLGYRLENLKKRSDSDIEMNPTKDDDTCYRELVQCVDQHINIIEFAALVESSYSTAYLIQVGFGIVLLSISGVQILIKFGHYDEMYRMFQFTSAQLLHLFFNSWPGQKLIDQCFSFRESIYFSEWYLLSMRAKKVFGIIMVRALTPQKMTAGKLYDMSMENFGAVVQTSVSYFTVFASLR